ncbi:spore coat U domain-containing protein [Zavarzinia sp.]|uniref:Csu type fimbrial protein n=1 Tax=Zavarzinia sp. TaxID=2027920 RepID=UPI003563D03F
MRAAKRLGLAVGLALLASMNAQAASDHSGGTFDVTATVTASCATSISTLAFGTYDPASASTGSTTLSVTCTNGTAYRIGADKGTYGSAVTAREMKATGADLLGYSLTIGTNGGTHLGSNWGNDTAAGSDTVDGTGSGSALSVTINGNIAAGQYVAPGAYSDTVTVTVWY